MNSLKNKLMDNPTTHITIAICTFNREYFLDKCLESIFSFSGDNSLIEILVIDNNSRDKSKEVVTKYQKVQTNLKYVVEKQIGLSNARNRALKETKTKFIGYIDDDVKVSETYIKRLLWLIDNYEFDCIGGMYYPWYLKDKPKWIPDEYGQKEMLRSTIGPIESDYNSGGNMVFKTEVLKKFGGFPPNLGMHGTKIRYGEEDYVQNLIRKNGGAIIFDPELIVYHVIQNYKLSIWWQLKSSFLNSKANVLIHHKKENIWFLFFQFFKSIIALLIKRLPIGLFKLLFDKDFYIQNLLLYTMKPVITNSGKLIAYFEKYVTIDRK